MMLHALLFVCLCGSALAKFPSFAPCPKVQTMPNFDIAKYMGRWYENRYYFTSFEIGAKCVTADYSLVENDTIHMVNTKVSIKGKPRSIEATARVPDPANPSKLKVKFALDPMGIETDYWVLGTDYETYAVVHKCEKAKYLDLKYAWILTREVNPPQSVVDKAFEVAASNNLGKSKFLKSDHSGCDY